MNQFIARQPIFDRHMKVYAYELLHRSNSTQNFADVRENPNKASSETMVIGFHNIGIAKITGGRRAFVNFTEQLLEAGVATLFPHEHLVVEILENVRPTETVIEACRQLKKKGYMLALDDFVLSDEMAPLLKLADIIKVDWLATPPREIPKLLSSVKPLTPCFLAEKIETKEAYEAALSMGFSLFQGYFFSKPTIISKKKAEPLMAHYLQLIRLANCEDVEFCELANIIRRDAVLTYRLLRLVNSAYFGMQYQVSDIQNALVILGLRETRKWVSLLAMMGICADKTEELVRVSLIRGRTLELFCKRFLTGEDAGNYFLIGLFSLLNIILDSSMSDVMLGLSVPHEVSSALTDGQGRAARLLQLLEVYERGQWDALREHCDHLGLSPEDLSKLYLEAVLWCGEFTT